MKGKFNYLTYILMFVVFVLFLTGVYLIAKFAFIIFDSNKNKTAVLIGLTFAFLGTIYGIIVLLDLLINYRYKIKQTEGGLLISDMLFLRHKHIQLDQIKTAQEDEYVYNIFLKAIVVTLTTGKKFKMLNFFICNYSSTKPILKTTKRSIKT
ncbi:hypothetical protein HRG84_18525 [Flavisolibacter sp. BT320]|nr:hypothetical protein [Flavisolibacter longurius]